jgi:V8-like Glu-specific endopeptidase
MKYRVDEFRTGVLVSVMFLLVTGFLVFFPQPVAIAQEPESTQTPAEDLETRLLDYDLQTGELSELNLIEDFASRYSNTSHLYSGMADQQIEDAAGSYLEGSRLDSASSTGALSNFTILSEIIPPDVYLSPWRMNVKLKLGYPSGLESGCSGVLVDEKHVVTAAHCIYAFDDDDHDYCGPSADSCWVSSVEVIPGYYRSGSSTVKPYGQAYALTSYVWNDWINNQIDDYDTGILWLDRPVGALTGHFYFGYNDSESWIESQTWHNASYPGDNPPTMDGTRMYYWYGTFDDVSTHNLRVDRGSHQGMSGSGVYYKDACNNRIVYGVLSRSNHDNTRTYLNRINSDRFNWILNAINGNTPSTFDLIPLDVNATPHPVYAGLQLSSLNYKVHNYSSVSYSGTVNVNLYLSLNPYIDGGDQYLSSHSSSATISAKGTLHVNVVDPPYIPIDQTSNDYYLIVHLNITDHNTGNNLTQGWDAHPFSIHACSKPSKPELVFPLDGSTTTDNYEDFDWNDALDADTYKIQADDNSNFSSPEVNDITTSSSYMNFQFLPDGMYYWRVQANNAYGMCDRDSDWSDVNTFHVIDDEEPDSSYTAIPVNMSNVVTRSISPADDVDWFTFNLNNWASLVLGTDGISGDTRMWLYDGSMTLIEFDDDDGYQYFSHIDRTCSNPPGKYYVKIDEYGNNDTIAEYTFSWYSQESCTPIFFPAAAR